MTFIRSVMNVRQYSPEWRLDRGMAPAQPLSAAATVAPKNTPRARTRGGGGIGRGFLIMEEGKNIDPVEERIKELTSAMRQAKTPAYIRKLLKGTIRNVAWLEIKLDEARANIPEGEILKEYDNGGGQKGMQKSPNLKAYEDLFRDYTSGMDEIMEALPKDSREPLKKRVKKSEPKNMLEKIRENQKNSI